CRERRREDLAREDTIGDRLSREGRTTGGQAVVIGHIRRFAALAIVAVCALAGPPSATAMAIERVVSAGGSAAWLVREPALPLIAMNFAFVGGAAEDPAEKPGVGYMVASLLDEGAGDLDAKAFQRRVEDTATELRFSVTHDYFYGSIRMLSERR